MTDEPDDDMTDELRAGLRDLLPDYRGPADPYARVSAAVRRRRRDARRTWLAAGVAAGAATIAVAPALVGLPSLAGLPALVGLRSLAGLPALAGHSGTGSIVAAAPRPLGPPVGLAGAEPVAAGSVAGQSWQVASTTLSTEARRCLYADGGPFSRSLNCFAEWTPKRNASWVVVTSPSDAAGGTTGVLGVVPKDARRVSVVFVDGRTVAAEAVRTGADPAVRFFAVAVAGSGTVSTVTTLTQEGLPLSGPDTESETPTGCVTAACATGDPAGPSASRGG